MEITDEALKDCLGAVLPHLDERQRRLCAGAVAEMVGRGGRTKVAKLTGMSRSTVIKGANEIVAGAEVSDRVREEGAGDKPAIEKQPGLWEAIEELVSPTTRGHPMSALRWTLKSTYELSREVKAQGFVASAELAPVGPERLFVAGPIEAGRRVNEPRPGRPVPLSGWPRRRVLGLG